jgi:hypothetical protein
MPRVFLVWLVLASCIGWAVYQLKYEVVQLEKRLEKVNRQILSDQEAIQILKAEWSYLNQPAHLQESAEKFLKLEPVLIKQMATMTQLATRRDGGMPLIPPTPPAAAAPAKPAPTDLDEETTTTPADIPEDPSPADLSVLLVKGVPQ